MPEPSDPETVDLLIVGGGINGCGIARDAAGRGLNVALVEQGDLASATSSASTKLFHGGLRYLEYFEFRLVREALAERETLLRAMPHISWPLRFVLPLHPDMRFETGTPAARLLSLFMPWTRGRRPDWVIRLALFLYDHMGGRRILPPTRTLDLNTDPAGAPLKSRFRKAFEYSDCWVEDSRLVLLNARDAAARGARILTRTRAVAADRGADLWTVTLEDAETGARRALRARMLVNAAGPWAGQVLHETLRLNSAEQVRLVRGSHIVTRRLYDHDRCYFFQGSDGRIIFAIPYEDDFTLIGTTDAPHESPDQRPEITPEEQAYLLDFASQYFARPVRADDIVWTYSGVRPLYDDGASSATAATRDYVLRIEATGGAPVLSIFGGKITTYRRLAEAALDRIGPHFPGLPGRWTAGVALPGGDFPVGDRAGLIARLHQDYPFLTEGWAARLIRFYGTEAAQVLGEAATAADLGEDFGGTLTARELDWSIDREWARCAEDVLWRRSRLGLRVTADEAARIDAYIRRRRGTAA